MEHNELEEALKRLRNRKALGKDGLKAEIFKCASVDFKRFWRFINIYWKNTKIQPD